MSKWCKGRPSRRRLKWAAPPMICLEKFIEASVMDPVNNLATSRVLLIT